MKSQENQTEYVPYANKEEHTKLLTSFNEAKANGNIPSYMEKLNEIAEEILTASANNNLPALNYLYKETKELTKNVKPIFAFSAAVLDGVIKDQKPHLDLKVFLSRRSPQVQNFFAEQGWYKYKKPIYQTGLDIEYDMPFVDLYDLHQKKKLGITEQEFQLGDIANKILDAINKKDAKTTQILFLKVKEFVNAGILDKEIFNKDFFKSIIQQKNIFVSDLDYYLSKTSPEIQDFFEEQKWYEKKSQKVELKKENSNSLKSDLGLIGPYKEGYENFYKNIPKELKNNSELASLGKISNNPEDYFVRSEFLEHVALNFLKKFLSDSNNEELCKKDHHINFEQKNKTKLVDAIFPACISFVLIEINSSVYCVVSTSLSSARSKDLIQALDAFISEYNKNFENKIKLIFPKEDRTYNFNQILKKKVGKNFVMKECAEKRYLTVLNKLFLVHKKKIKVLACNNYQFYPFKKNKIYGNQPGSIDTTVRSPFGEKVFFDPYLTGIIPCCKTCRENKKVALNILHFSQDPSHDRDLSPPRFKDPTSPLFSLFERVPPATEKKTKEEKRNDYEAESRGRTREQRK